MPGLAGPSVGEVLAGATVRVAAAGRGGPRGGRAAVINTAVERADPVPNPEPARSGAVLTALAASSCSAITMSVVRSAGIPA